MSGHMTVRLHLDFDLLVQQKEMIETLQEYYKDDENMVHLNGVKCLFSYLVTKGEEQGFYKKEEYEKV
jgi:hypothetical protein